MIFFQLVLLTSAFLRNSPVCSGKTKWELVQFRYLLFDCLDTVRVKSWHDEQIITSSYFHVEGVKKEILEEENEKIIYYRIKRSGKVEEIAKGVVGKNAFLLKDAVSGELYEEKIIEQTPYILVTSSEPGRLSIFFNSSRPSDSLRTAQINSFMLKSGKAFGKTIPYCK